ncbi:GNAT family N-acetyltransferase [bacterium]|nr:GNAT family N-acetyltransferase [bacterium]
MNRFLVGKKVYLAPFELDDAKLACKWFNDFEVTKFLQMRFPLNLFKEEELLKKITTSEKDVLLKICLTENDKPIGTAGLHGINTINRNAVFGISIGEKAEWNKGYGTEATELLVGYAFEKLNLNKVSLRVYAYNPRGKKTYEKVGFKLEGILRQEVFYGGTYHDEFLMGILAEEWFKKAEN